MKYVRSLLKKGLSKVEVFQRGVYSGLSKRQVSRYLSLFPDPEQSEKYHTANLTFIILYSIVVMLATIGSVFEISYEFLNQYTAILFFCSLLFDGFILYGLYKKNALSYLIVAFLCFKGSINCVRDFDMNMIGAWIGLSIDVSLFIYAMSLKIWLFPYQNLFHSKRYQEGVYCFTGSEAEQNEQS